MQIVIIGSGNTATVLAKKLKAAGHVIAQVYSRNAVAAAALAAELQTVSCSHWNDITRQADYYIIAIADSALTGNELHLQLTDQLVVHTAGAVSIDALQHISSRYGVLYPYQSLRKEIEPLPDIPFLVDGNSAMVKEQLVNLAGTISGKVSIAGDAERMKYHLCAVIANNFSNYLYTLTEDFCKSNGLDFSNLLPLIDETSSRLHHASPRGVQTGPAIRKDPITIEHHLQLLQQHALLKKWYRQFSDEIQQYKW